jgi:hypothetical protein
MRDFSNINWWLLMALCQEFLRRWEKIIPIHEKSAVFFLTICKESAISPTDITNMRIRSSKVPIVAPMMGVATLIVGAVWMGGSWS